MPTLDKDFSSGANRLELTIEFDGGLADSHRLPAISGSQAIEGISRSIIIISHYLVTANVRQKAPFSDDAQLLLTSFEPGSFKATFQWAIKKPALMSTIGLVAGAAVTGPVEKYATDFVSYIVNQTVGNAVQPDTSEIGFYVEVKRGDAEALMQTITPALKRSHNVVGDGSESIILMSPRRNLALLDSETKSYINQDRFSKKIEQKLVRVSRLNGNQREVGVYDLEERRVITGFVPAEAEPRTLGNLGRSLTAYVDEVGETEVSIKYRKVTDPNGRIVRYVILDAWFAPPENAWQAIFGNEE